MRRSLTLLATVALLIGLLPAAALATPPEVVAEGEFAASLLQVEATAACGFDVYVDFEGTYKVTVFFDKDGEPVSQREHVNGTALWTSANSQSWDTYAFNVDIDYATGLATLTGNIENAHAGAGGILLNDSGRIILGGADVIVNGPHQLWFGDFDGLCEALS